MACEDAVTAKQASCSLQQSRQIKLPLPPWANRSHFQVPSVHTRLHVCQCDFDSLTAIAFEAAQLLLSACVHAECSHPSCWKKNKYVSSFIASVLINSTRNNEAGIVLGAHVRSSIRHQLKCSPLGFLSKKHISPNYNKWQLSLLHWPSLATARRWGRRRKEKPALCPCMGFHFYCVWLLFL